VWRKRQRERQGSASRAPLGVGPAVSSRPAGRIADLSSRLHVDRGGRGPRTLLLLHGMGASGAVWRDFVTLLDEEWTWVAPDLPGHGYSAPAAPYRYDTLVAALAPLVEEAEGVTVLGHSLGGALALALAASRPDLAIRTVIGTSIKVRWTAEEVDGMAAVAAKPARVFPDRADATTWALRLAGLAGLVTPDAPAAARLVAQTDGGWRAAFDPAIGGIGTPDVAGAVRALSERGVRIMLASGDKDAMAPAEDLAAVLPSTRTLPGVGHNIPAERPEALLDLLTRAED